MKHKDQLKEYKRMNLANLLKKEIDLKNKIFDLKMKMSVGKAKNTSQIRHLRKNLARIKTFIIELATKEMVKNKVKSSFAKVSEDDAKNEEKHRKIKIKS